MPKRILTPREAAAFALAMLESKTNHPREFLCIEACEVLEGAQVCVDSEEREPGDWQVEVCSGVDARGRDAFAIVGMGATMADALQDALDSLFDEHGGEHKQHALPLADVTMPMLRTRRSINIRMRSGNLARLTYRSLSPRFIVRPISSMGEDRPYYFLADVKAREA